MSGLLCCPSCGHAWTPPTLGSGQSFMRWPSLCLRVKLGDRVGWYCDRCYLLIGEGSADSRADPMALDPRPFLARHVCQVPGGPSE